MHHGSTHDDLMRFVARIIAEVGPFLSWGGNGACINPAGGDIGQGR